MMNRYRFYSKKFNCTAILSYQDGFLKHIDFEDNPNSIFVTYPTMEQHFLLICKKENYKYWMLPNDLSFENFWKVYNLKVKKEASQKAYEKLSLEDKAKCFLKHKQYEDFLKKTGQAKAHLVTWINQKRYNDELNN
jgi:hypothetical protein